MSVDPESLAAAESAADVAGPATGDVQTPLTQDASFWGLLITQFLGAFNDNVFKQIVLFVCVKQALEQGTSNLQGVAAFAFALPFVLLSGVCGVLADRYSKRGIIVLSKVLEIVVMVLGGLAFWYGSLTAMILVLLAMGAQSALFGPSKYGVLPELFRSGDLPQANGWILMTTFVSIILGGILAGQLMVWWSQQLWLASLVCIGIAVAGTLSSLPIRRTAVAHPGLQVTAASLFITADMRRLLRARPALLNVVLASSVFWCVGAIYQLGINDLGILQFKLSEARTAYLAAWAAIGIAIGGSLSGQLSRQRFDARLVYAGLWGMIITLCLLACPGPLHGQTLLGIYGSAAALALLGASAGLFAVPISVYAQTMTPGQQKGQIIGVMNLCNWIGILGAAGVHLLMTRLLTANKLPPNLVFLAGVLLLGVVAVLYRPVSMDLETGELAAEPARI